MTCNVITRDELWLIVANHVNPIPLCKRLIRDGLWLNFGQWDGEESLLGASGKDFYPLKWKRWKRESSVCSCLLPSENACVRMRCLVSQQPFCGAVGQRCWHTEDGRAKERKNLGPWWHSGITEPTLELLTSRQLIHASINLYHLKYELQI